MKKFLFLLFLFPLSINALSEKDFSIECNNLKIGTKANCVFKINNEEKNNINIVTFDYDENLSNVKSSYEIKKEEKYEINLKTDDNTIDVFSFDYLMEYNDIDINLKNLNIKYDEESITLDNFSKNLKIENIAFVDNILINNQPIIDFNKNIYNYKVDLYERNDYVEIKVISSGNNTITGKANKIYKFVNGATINIEVKNESDTETYKITLNYNKQRLNVSKIKIKEIPFDFVLTKRYYYLEVTKDVSKITIENDSVNKKYDLNIGKNKIIFNNNGINYIFVINRLKQNQSINLGTNLKSLKIGDNYLDLKEDSYNYTYKNDKVDLVEVETLENQDYDIKYNDDKIVINLYDANANKTSYTINLIDKNNTNNKVKNYSKAKSIIFFVIFLIVFVILAIVSFKKYKLFKRKYHLKKERIKF